MKKILFMLSIYILSTSVPFVQARTFPDVPTTHPNYNAISQLSDDGVINGYPDGTFKPDQAVNRAEALKIILLSEKYSTPTTVSSLPFPDTNSSAWYAPYIQTGYSNKVVSGYPDGKFYPEKTLNLVESLKMVLLAAMIDPNVLYSTLTTPPYNDVPLNQWFTNYAQYAKDYVLIDADTNNNIHPALSMTRASLVEVMYRKAHGDQSWYSEIDKLYNEFYEYDGVEDDLNLNQF